MQSVLKLVVVDGQGVMDRILNIIRRFGCNISSIAAAEIEEGISDISIAFHTKGVDVESVGQRLASLDCVRSWEECTEGGDLLREMVLVRINQDQMDTIDITDIRILEEKDGVIYFEYTGTPGKIDEILKKLRELKFTFTRTGPICLSKGSTNAQ